MRSSICPNLLLLYGSRKDQILQVRLRTGCSSLNMDLFHKNITENPLCRCGSIEDTQHYFFTADFTTLSNACTTHQNPSLSLLLLSSSTLSLEANIAIHLEQVHKYNVLPHQVSCLFKA